MPASSSSSWRRAEENEQAQEEQQGRLHDDQQPRRPPHDANDADDAAPSSPPPPPKATATSPTTSSSSLPIALFYFFYFSSLATFVPFVSLYLRDSAPARLTAAQVGAVASLRPFVSAPAGVLLSALADRRSWHLPLLVAGHALCAVCRALLVPLSGTLAGVVAVTIASEVLGAPVCVVADAAAVAEAGALGYGSLRLWGAVGWGGMSLISGTLLHRGGMGAATAAYLVLAGLALPAAMRVPCGGIAKKKEVVVDDGGGEKRSLAVVDVGDDYGDDDDVARVGRDVAVVPTTTTTTTTTTTPPPPTSVAQLLRREPGVALFLATACLFGVGVGAIGEFLFLHLRDSLGAPEWVMGASLAVTCAAEVPAFRLQPALLKALGVRGALRLVALAYVARTALYAALPTLARGLLGGGHGGGGRFLPPPYVLVLPVEVLHGLCFAVAWATGTAHARRAAPPGCEAELQGWFSGCFFGLGQGVGCLVAGALYGRLGGGEGMFAAVSVGLCVGFAALEACGVWWPWGFGGGGGGGGGAGDQGGEEEEEGAWLRGWTERARVKMRGLMMAGGGDERRQQQSQQQQQQRYRKLEHKNSDAELALVDAGARGRDGGG